MHFWSLINTLGSWYPYCSHTETREILSELFDLTGLVIRISTDIETPVLFGYRDPSRCSDTELPNYPNSNTQIPVCICILETLPYFYAFYMGLGGGGALKENLLTIKNLLSIFLCVLLNLKADHLYI